MSQTHIAVVAATIVGLCLPAQPTDDLNNPPPNQAHFPQDLAGGRPYQNLPTQITIASIDTTHDDKEIVLATQDLISNTNTLTCTGHVYVYNPNGTLRWSAQLPQPPGMGASVADLNGDGVNDVIVGYGELLTGCMIGGGVKALNGVDGSEMWNFLTLPQAGLGGVYATPAIGDVNGDGYPEVVFGSWDQCIYMLDHEGNSLWNFDKNPNNACNGRGHFMYDRVSSTAALADLNGDGKLEIVIGSDATTSYFISHPPYVRGGYLNVLREDGVLIAQSWFYQAIQSSPAIADLNGDGVLDIVVGSGESINAQGLYVTAWHYDESQCCMDNRLVNNWIKDVNGYVMSSPAIGDLNGDGVLDVVAITPNGNTTTLQGSTVYAWSGNGTELFHRLLCDVSGAKYYLHTSPVIADVVGDVKPEVVLTQNYETIILNPDGTFYTDQPTNNCNGQPSTTALTYWAGAKLDAIPAISDIDNGGHGAILVAGAVDDGAKSNYGRLFAWGGHNSGYASWAQFHHDAAHTGLLDNVPPGNPSGFTVSPLTGTLMMPQTITVTWTITGKDMGAGLAGYAVSVNRYPDSLPLPSSDITTGIGSITAMPGVGTWYAHVRAVDKAGNGALTAVHLGPFLFHRAQAFLPMVARE
ncbi:MAG: VCBS repeat-containing protein [Chloroflexi bacterium]|nr:VCBS repeat-containing protein [Chloroflexota bacterium]MCL5275883.1 VCBS repeat-containing protein [Chloroflexota bacterium]